MKDRQVIGMAESDIIAIGNRIEIGVKERKAVEVQYPQLRGRLWFHRGSRIIVEPDTPENRAKAEGRQATRDTIDKSVEREAAGFGAIIKDLPWQKIPKKEGCVGKIRIEQPCKEGEFVNYHAGLTDEALEAIECGCVTDTQSCPACRATVFANHTTPGYNALMDFGERVTELMRCKYGRMGIPGQRPAEPPEALKIAQTRVAEWLADRLPRETLQEAAGLAYGQHADLLLQAEGTDVRTDWTRMHGGA